MGHLWDSRPAIKPPQTGARLCTRGVNAVTHIFFFFFLISQPYLQLLSLLGCRGNRNQVAASPVPLRKLPETTTTWLHGPLLARRALPQSYSGLLVRIVVRSGFTDGRSGPSRCSGDGSDARAGVCTQTLNRGQTSASTRVWKHAELRAHVSDEKRKADLWTAGCGSLSSLICQLRGGETREEASQQTAEHQYHRGKWPACSRWHTGSTPTTFSDSKHFYIHMDLRRKAPFFVIKPLTVLNILVFSQVCAYSIVCVLSSCRSKFYPVTGDGR